MAPPIEMSSHTTTSTTTTSKSSSGSSTKRRRRRSTDETSKKSVGEYTFIRTLGEGSFGKVKLAVRGHTSETYAVKVFEKSRLKTDKSLDRLSREIKVMALLQHQNIAQLYDVIEDKKRLYVIIEYCEGGELFDYLISCGKLPEHTARRFFRDIASAVKYCHDNFVTHRDLKLENILLDKDQNAKLIDFGLCHTLDTYDELLHTKCGSPFYAPPEIVRSSSPYSGPEVDVWSLGVVLYCLVTGSMPFGSTDISKRQLYDNIESGRFAIPSFLSDSCADLLRRMLVVDPSARANMAEVFEHEWVNVGCERPPSAHVPLRPTSINSLNEAALDALVAIGFDKDSLVEQVTSQRQGISLAAYHLMCERIARDAELEAQTRAAQIEESTGRSGRRRRRSSTSSSADGMDGRDLSPLDRAYPEASSPLSPLSPSCLWKRARSASASGGASGASSPSGLGGIPENGPAPPSPSSPSPLSLGSGGRSASPNTTGRPGTPLDAPRRRSRCNTADTLSASYGGRNSGTNVGSGGSSGLARTAPDGVSNGASASLANNPPSPKRRPFVTSPTSDSPLGVDTSTATTTPTTPTTSKSKNKGKGLGLRLPQLGSSDHPAAVRIQPASPADGTDSNPDLFSVSAVANSPQQSRRSGLTAALSGRGGTSGAASAPTSPAVANIPSSPNTRRNRLAAALATPPRSSSAASNREPTSPMSCKLPHAPALEAAKQSRKRRFSVQAPQEVDNLGASGSELESNDAIRVVKGPFSLAATSRLGAADIRDIVCAALTGANIDYTLNGYLFDCDIAVESPAGGSGLIPSSPAAGGPPCEYVRLTIEVCRLSRMPLHGLRFRRVTGSTWAYRRQCLSLLSLFKL